MCVKWDDNAIDCWNVKMQIKMMLFSYVTLPVSFLLYREFLTCRIVTFHNDGIINQDAMPNCNWI